MEDRELGSCWGDMRSTSMCLLASRPLSVLSMNHLRYTGQLSNNQVANWAICSLFQETTTHSIELLEDVNHTAVKELASHLGLQLVRNYLRQWE